MAFPRNSLVIFASVLTLACVVLAKDAELSAGDIQVKVLGKSGKIAIYRNISVTKREGNETKTKVKRNGVLFDFDSIKEKDKDGNEVGAKGKDKHSFNGFAKLEFTVSGIQDGKLQNVSVKWFSFEAKKIGAAEGNIKVIIYLVKEDGEIDIGKNESEKLSKGSVKFSVKIDNWKFCGKHVDCKDKNNKNLNGSYIDFVLTLTSKGGKKRGGPPKCGRRPRCGKIFDIGQGNMTLSNEVQVDDEWQEMSGDFPAVGAGKGGKRSITLRFPKFVNSTFYDPTISMGDTPVEDDDDDDDDDDEKPTDGVAHISLSITLFIFSVFAAFFY